MQTEGRDGHKESKPTLLLLKTKKQKQWQLELWGRQAIPGVPQAHRCLYPLDLVPGLGPYFSILGKCI